MTSIHRRILKATMASLAAGSLFAGGAAAQNVGSQSPFGYTGRLSGTNLSSTGFQNSGFQNTGFRSTGFQNAGFRNSAVSNTGFRNGGTRMASYPNINLPGVGYNGGVAPTGPAMNYTPVFNNSPPPGIGLNQLQGAQGPFIPIDDSATISVGPNTSLNSGFAMPVISRGPRFTVGLGFESPVGTTNPQLGKELESQLANSPSFPAGKNISVTVENNVVILRGKVADDHERDLAEAVIRLSPGVYNVRNELMVGDTTASNK
jgi:hypothetical protein